jgi:hypothetical protein
LPAVVLTLRRLPADSWLPGHTPVQEARSAAVGNRDHVGAGLGDDHVDREPIESGNRQLRLIDRFERGGSSIDLFGERTDRGVEESR